MQFHPPDIIAARTDTFWDHVKDSLRQHAVFLVICCVSLAISIAINVGMGSGRKVKLLLYFRVIFIDLLAPVIVAAFPLVLGYIAVFTEKPHPLKTTLALFKRHMLDTQRNANALVVLVGMVIGYSAFLELKPLIPLFNPFESDLMLSNLDRTLHFGRDPWLWSMEVFGTIKATARLDALYYVWFQALFLFWIASAWSKAPRSTDGVPHWGRQYPLTIILCWMFGGILLATVFSSMGPIFYDLTPVDDGRYAAQMAWLESVNETDELMTLWTADILRTDYLFPGTEVIAGISAMPSMHVAAATIFMLTAYRMHKWFGHAMVIYLAIMMIGSVHLAWHYAVDGYVGIVIALLCWWVAGRLLRWHDTRALKARG